MKVYEAIEELKKLPPNVEVYIPVPDVPNAVNSAIAFVPLYPYGRPNDDAYMTGVVVSERAR